MLLSQNIGMDSESVSLQEMACTANLPRLTTPSARGLPNSSSLLDHMIRTTEIS